MRKTGLPKKDGSPQWSRHTIRAVVGESGKNKEGTMGIRAQIILMIAVMAWMGSGIGGWDASAATVIWDRNNDQNVKGYNVYVCYEKDCVINESTQLMFVNQPTAGNPQCDVNIEGKAGSIGVNAWNYQGKQSPLTIIRYDKTK
jgi:hypothetical protein